MRREEGRREEEGTRVGNGGGSHADAQQSEQAEKQRAPEARSGEKGRAKRKDREYHGREYEDHGKKKRA